MKTSISPKTRPNASEKRNLRFHENECGREAEQKKMMRSDLGLNQQNAGTHFLCSRSDGDIFASTFGIVNHRTVIIATTYEPIRAQIINDKCSKIKIIFFLSPEKQKGERRKKPFPKWTSSAQRASGSAKSLVSIWVSKHSEKDVLKPLTHSCAALAMAVPYRRSFGEKSHCYQPQRTHAQRSHIIAGPWAIRLAPIGGEERVSAALARPIRPRTNLTR